MNDSSIFYREAGPTVASTILLLHGFRFRPTCSVISFPFWPITSMWSRPISQALASRICDREHFRYTFENLTRVIDGFTQTRAVERYAIYIFDYGAPAGLRLALAHPDRITAIVSQNGDAL